MYVILELALFCIRCLCMASIALSYICMGVVKYRANLNHRADDEPRGTRVPNLSVRAPVSGVRDVVSVIATCSLNVLFSVKKIRHRTWVIAESRALTTSTHRMNRHGHLAGSQTFRIGPAEYLNHGQ